MIPLILSTALLTTTDTPLNRQVTNFTLKDYRGKQHSLADFANHKLLVVAFLGTECPLAKLYGPRLARLSARFGGRGVGFVGVNANVQDSITELGAYTRIHGIKFPVLKDLGNRVADQMGAVRTPEVFVLDEMRVVRYWGRVDDQYGIGSIRDKARREDLAEALEELLAGKPVSVPVAEAVGCYIGRIREPNPTATVTYSNQIARILQNRCVECHRTGEIAPFALTDYDEVVGWAETIEEVVDDNRMPPWHANPEYGKFVNDRHMTTEEKELIRAWVSAGAPEGDPKDLPKPMSYVKGWQLSREPDMVVNMRDKPFQVAAEGTIRYQYFTVDPGFTEDKWVQAAELVPGNRKVVHHILLFARPPKGAPGGAVTSGQFLAAYVPGKRARSFPDGMAKRVPAGSKLVFQMHYTPIGSPQEDMSKLGLIFADPQSITHAVTTMETRNRKFKIPPHDGNYRVEATSQTSPVEIKLLAMMPHMHLRGKAFQYQALAADGTREILLDVPAYDFNWQTSYQFAEPRSIAPGTRIHCVAHFDNSADNIHNPNPNATVGWGDQTWNEMMIGYFDIAVPIDANTSRPTTTGNTTAKKARARAILNEYDRDGDGRVQLKEIPLRVLRQFRRLDRDRDNVVTLEEIERGLK